VNKYPSVTIRLTQELLDRMEQATEQLPNQTKSTIARAAIQLWLEIHAPKQ
jgi:predicted transcriptional regulator